jgi:hypothetical protein
MQPHDDAVGERVGEVSRRTDIGGKTPLGRDLSQIDVLPTNRTRVCHSSGDSGQRFWMDGRLHGSNRQPMTFDLARHLRCESDLAETKRTCIYILLL